MSSEINEESLHMDESTAAADCGTEICDKKNVRASDERVAAFFLKDLHKAKKCENKDIFRGPCLYTLMGITFDSVSVTGTITAIFKSATRGIKVDDGTSEIRCIFEQDKMATLTENIQTLQNEIKTNFACDDDCDRAAAMILSNFKRHEVKQMPRIDTLKLGQQIRLEGRLYLAHEERFVIYIDKYEIVPINIQAEKEYAEKIELLYDLYKTEGRSKFI